MKKQKQKRIEKNLKYSKLWKNKNLEKPKKKIIQTFMGKKCLSTL